MVIPPFTPTAEIHIERNHPEIVECQQKYDAIVGLEAQITNRETSYSDDFGYILRVKYYPRLDDTVLKDERIFMCWKINGKLMQFILSGLAEEDDILKNLSQLNKHDR